MTGIVTCTSNSNASLSEGGVNKTFIEQLPCAKLYVKHLNTLFNLIHIAILRYRYNYLTFTDGEIEC